MFAGVDAIVRRISEEYAAGRYDGVLDWLERVRDRIDWRIRLWRL